VLIPARQFRTVQQHWKSAGSYSTLGLEVGLSVVFGLFLGRWLDGKFGTGSVLTVVWFLFGVAAGGRAIYRALKRANAEAERAEAEAKEQRKSYLDGTNRKP
jgi:ATP synthase protein I